jgi:hypothetical protein
MAKINTLVKLIVVGFKRPYRPRYRNAELPREVLLLDSEEADTLTKEMFPRVKKIVLDSALSNPLFFKLEREFGGLVVERTSNPKRLHTMDGLFDIPFCWLMYKFYAAIPPAILYQRLERRRVLQFCAKRKAVQDKATATAA